MLPRLLNKREIDAKKAQERKLQMDEGGKLARTVDTLRELRSKEEQEFEAWRVQTLAEIQRAINEKAEQSNLLDIVIERKQELRAKLEAPLDEAWAELEAQRIQFQKERQELEERDKNLQYAVALNIRRERDNKAREDALEVANRKIDQLKEGYLSDLRESKARLTQVRETEKKVLADIAARDAKSQERSIDLDYRQSNIELVRLNYEKKLKELEARQKLLNDRTALLERNIKRYGGHTTRNSSEG